METINRNALTEQTTGYLFEGELNLTN